MILFLSKPWLIFSHSLPPLLPSICVCHNLFFDLQLWSAAQPLPHTELCLFYLHSCMDASKGSQMCNAIMAVFFVLCVSFNSSWACFAAGETKQPPIVFECSVGAGVRAAGGRDRRPPVSSLPPAPLSFQPLFCCCCIPLLCHCAWMHSPVFSPVLLFFPVVVVVHTVASQKTVWNVTPFFFFFKCRPSGLS